MKKRLGLAVPLLAFAAFLPALLNGFVHWDDYPFIIKNAGLGDLRWMLTTTSFGLYQPLSWLSLSLDRALWGLDPFGFHLTSLLLHAFNAGLVFMLGVRLLKDESAALTAALLFALHPLRAEAVAWAATRKDVLAASFYLLTTLLYLERRERPALACFAAGLLAKGSGIGLPVVLWMLERRRGLGFFFGLSAVFGVVGAAVSLKPEGHGPLQGLGLTIYGLAFYLRKTVWPVDLGPYYEVPVPFTDLWPMVTGSFLLLVLLGAAAWRWKPLRLPLFSYLVLLIPVQGVVQFARHMAADRYSYLACIPIALALGRVRLLLWVTPLLFALSWRQAGFWKDTHTLWERAVAVWPRSSVSQTNLAASLSARGRDEEALVRARAAVKMDPSYSEARENLGLLLTRLARYEEAEKYLGFRPATEARMRFNWGNALLRQGRRKAAAVQYERALALDPSFEPARLNLRKTR
jgi:tetratricopeptide (TPR) repeat protein